MRLKKLLLSSAVAALWCVSGTVMAGNPIFVKPGGTGDGSSWEKAMGSVTAAAYTGAHAEGRDVWVAKGTYEVKETLSPKLGMNIYGGFEGTEAKLDDRKAGEKSKLVMGTAGTITLNATINNGAYPNMPAVFDGFEVTGMNSTKEVFVIYEGRTVSNCIIHHNTCGKVVMLEKGKIVNCAIYGNTAETNGAVIFRGGTAINCTIVGNNAKYNAGGVYFYDNTLGQYLYNSVIWGNTATNAAQGPVYAAGNNSTYVIQNCAIQANKLITDGTDGNKMLDAVNDAATGPKFADPSMSDYRLAAGSICLDAGDNAVATGIDYDLNGKARISGTTIDMGAYEGVVVPVISNIIYVKENGTGSGTSWEDAAGDLNSVFSKLGNGSGKDVWVAKGTYQATATINVPTTVNVYGGFSGDEEDLSERDLSQKSTIKGGTWLVLMNLTAESDDAKATTLDGFEFTAHNATGDVSGNNGVVVAYKNRNINNCIAYGNACVKNSGFYVEGTISNCLVYGNTAKSYNAAVQLNNAARMVNCTVVDNTGANGGLRVHSQAKVYNSIIWGNSPKTAHIDGATAEFINCALPVDPVFNNANPVITDCINLKAENVEGPKFTNPATHNYTLAEGSPCINAGLNSAVKGDKDIAGNDRIQKTTVDLGAYESGLSTGITEHTVSTEVIGYPNPVKDVLTITAEGAQRVEIYAVSGARVFLQEIMTNGQINLSGLNSGYYVVNVYTTNGYKRAAIIKE